MFGQQPPQSQQGQPGAPSLFQQQGQQQGAQTGNLFGGIQPQGPQQPAQTLQPQSPWGQQAAGTQPQTLQPQTLQPQTLQPQPQQQQQPLQPLQPQQPQNNGAPTLQLGQTGIGGNIGNIAPANNAQQVNNQDPYTVYEQVRKSSLKNAENLIKTAEIRTQVDKNYEVLSNIANNAINKVRAPQPQARLPNTLDNGQQKKPQQQERNYTNNTVANYNNYKGKLGQLLSSQNEILSGLNEIQNKLGQVDEQGYQDMWDEESVCIQTKNLCDEVGNVSKQVEHVIKMQKEIIESMDDEGDDWEYAYKALYKCIIQLDEDINQTEEALVDLESNPKVKSAQR